MKTNTEYAPTANVPSSVYQPPSNNVAVNPHNIAILINGVNAADKRIALRFASR